MSSSSNRNENYSRNNGGGGGPDRSYPSMRNSYMDNRSRPYDSPYERQRMAPNSSTNHSDTYSMRNSPRDSYNRDDYTRPRGSTMSMGDPYGRGAPTRYVVLRLFFFFNSIDKKEKKKKRPTIRNFPFVEKLK